MSYQLHLARKYCLITFPSTQHALKAEKILKDQAKDFIIIPTPREISSSCGLSIKTFCQENEHVLNTLKENTVAFESVYHVDKENSENLISKLDHNITK